MTVSETDLRAEVRDAAIVERAHWFDAGGAIDETVDTQFGYLVRYWLASKSGILPTTLTFAQARAIDPSFVWGPLLSAGASDAEIATARDALLLDAPGVGSPPDLNTLVKGALTDAYGSGQGDPDLPWSAVFVVSCVRGTAIGLGLEEVSGGVHVGRDELLFATVGHRFYVLEAYNRRFGLIPTSRTYHAFQPSERPVDVGDIIVVDRQVPNTGDIADVVAFEHIPAVFGGPYKLHGDVVVEVTSSYAETIGGNLGYQEPLGGDLCHLSTTKTTFASRRRRYPLSESGDGTLQVMGERLFVQEDQNGVLPALPVTCPDDGLHDRSTGRVFTLLSPVGF